MELTLRNIIKYILEGLATAVAAHYINKKTSVMETLTIGLTAATAFFVLDLLAPSMGESARHGAGFGIGQAQVGGYAEAEAAPEVEAADVASVPGAVTVGAGTGDVIKGSDGVDRLPTLDEQQNDVDRLNAMKSGDIQNNQGAEYIVNNSVPYRLQPTQYGVMALHPGYNDKVVSYNKEENDNELAEY